MNIYTKRLRLVPLGLEYLISTHKYSSDFDNTKYMVHLPNTNIFETKIFLERVQEEWNKNNPQFYEFAILLNNKHIGAVCIYLNNDYQEGELGWIINKEYWGNGYAIESAREIINFAIHNLNIKRFIANCDGENIKSYRVMKKLGMSLVSKINGRRNKFSTEERDELMYSLEVTS